MLAVLAFFHGRSLFADVSAESVFGREVEDEGSSVTTDVLILTVVNDSIQRLRKSKETCKKLIIRHALLLDCLLLRSICSNLQVLSLSF